jgi:hypothetical protein
VRERICQLVLLDGQPLVLVGVREPRALELVHLEPNEVELTRS